MALSDQNQKSDEHVVHASGSLDEIVAQLSGQVAIMRKALEEIKIESDVIPHEEPDQWGAIHKLEEVWTLANDALEQIAGP